MSDTLIGSCYVDFDNQYQYGNRQKINLLDAKRQKCACITLKVKKKKQMKNGSLMNSPPSS